MKNMKFCSSLFQFFVSVLLIYVLSISGCLNPPEVPAAESGDSVSIHLIGMYENGSVFNTTIDRKTIDFVIGDKTLLDGLEDQIIGMHVGDHKTFKLTPPYYSSKVITYPAEFFEQSGIQDPTVGDQIILNTTAGQKPGIIKKVHENGSADIDFNDPLAGKELTFEISLVNLTKKSAES